MAAAVRLCLLSATSLWGEQSILAAPVSPILVGLWKLVVGGGYHRIDSPSSVTKVEYIYRNIEKIPHFFVTTGYSADK